MTDSRFPFETPTRLALRELVNALALDKAKTPGEAVQAADKAARDVLEETYLVARGYVLVDESKCFPPFPFELWFRTPGKPGRSLISRHRTITAWKLAAAEHDLQRQRAGE